MLAMLSAAFQHGADYELVAANPVPGIAKAKMTADRKRPNRAWTPDERNNVMAAAWPQLRLPLALARFLGIPAQRHRPDAPAGLQGRLADLPGGQE